MDEEREKKSSRDRVRKYRAIKADINDAIAKRLQNHIARFGPKFGAKNGPARNKAEFRS